MKTFTNCAEKKAKQFFNLLQGYTKGIRMTTILILLLMGVSNAWAHEQFNEIWGTYDIGDGNQNAAFSSDKELGNVSKFTIQAFYLKCKDNWGASRTCWNGGALYYKVNNGNFTEVINTATDWKPDGWAEAEYQFKKENMQVTLATNSGKYTVEFYGKVWGNHDTYLNDNGNNYQWTFNILPPDISNFTVTATGHISGSGTSGDPYIIPSGQSLTLKLSGSKAHTDANSSLQYNTSGTWNTTTSKTISNITSTTKTSVTVKMRCCNSSANLSGTESSKTIYYKAVEVKKYTVKFNANGGSGNMTNQEFTYGVTQNLKANTFTREGYTFTKWNTQANGSGTNYSDKQSVSNLTSTNGEVVNLYAQWEEAQYTVTFGTTGHGQILFENTSTVINGSGSRTSQQKHGASISFTATPFAGYEVEGWYSNADCTRRIEAAGTHTRYNPAPVTSDVTIYVKFKEETRRIYLKPAGDNKWADGNARFAMYVIDDQTWYSMTKINDNDDDTGNDIYYCDIKPTYQKVIFCRMNPDNLTNNWNNKWTQTIDLTLEDDCNLFDIDAEDKGQEYPNIDTGKWMEYNAWQLVGSFAGWDPCGNRFDENSDGTYTYTIELTEGDYKFKLVRNGIWYGNSGTMERNGNGVQDGGWEMNQDHDCTLKADMTGNYIFTIHEDGKLTVTYPVTGYQLKITMNNGKVYTSNSVGNSGEILSFFAPGQNETGDNAGTIELCFEGEPIQNGTIAKETFATSNVYVATLNANKNGIKDVALYDGNYYIRTDGAAGGWNNYKQNSNKMTYFVPRADEKYSYYWVESVRHSDDNNRVNVKGCVGNQYNNDLAGMIESDKFTDVNGDVFIVDPTVNGNLHREKVNLRFGYNPKTNFFERAMLTGSGNTSTFLNITDPEGYVYKINDNGTLKKPLTTPGEDSKFMDISNWVYQTDVWVNIPSDEVDITVRLTGTAYNKAVNSLFGFDDVNNTIPTQKTIIGAESSEGKKKMRIIYDFKTNRMIMAWIPGETSISRNDTLQADVLFIRQENNEVPQLTFAENGQIEGVQSQFFALELINDKDSTYGNHEKQYWLSLPFDCVVGSISGVPGYMEIWGIQRYNGKKRAEIGWFKETSTFWEWLTPKDTLKAGEGYVLSFDKNAATWNTFDLHDDAGNVTGQTSLLRLYFPSMGSGYTFHNAQPTRIYENQNCTITRDNRHLQDGNWKIIGPMSYNNVTATPTIKTNRDSIWKPEQDGDHVDVPDNYQWSAPMFRYRYWRNSDPTKRNDWKYIPENGQDSVYKSFYGYMVQFAGNIQWNSVSESVPSALAARRNAASIPNNITTRLVLEDAHEVLHDQTFVALDVDGTTTFDQNKDLNKVLNTGYANIYTLSEGIPFAGNTLPMGEALVPVGVQIAAEGEYTFRMPDGTEGMVVELVDYETNTRTNLLLSDYIITLPKGTSENRFALHIQPQKDVVTGVENIGENGKVKTENGKPNKYLIDGKLIIRTAEGVVYDAQGHRL